LVSHVGLNLLRPKPISIKLEMRIKSINFFSNHVAHNITNTDIIASNEDDIVVSQRYLYCKKILPISKCRILGTTVPKSIIPEAMRIMRRVWKFRF
jgi:hypothetical protein